jgi:hypothetical protein
MEFRLLTFRLFRAFRNPPSIDLLVGTSSAIPAGIDLGQKILGPSGRHQPCGWNIIGLSASIDLAIGTSSALAAGIDLAVGTSSALAAGIDLAIGTSLALAGRIDLAVRTSSALAAGIDLAVGSPSALTASTDQRTDLLRPYRSATTFWSEPTDPYGQQVIDSSSRHRPLGRITSHWPVRPTTVI